MFVPDGAKPEEVAQGALPRRAGPSSRCAISSLRTGSTCRCSMVRTRRAAGCSSRTSRRHAGQLPHRPPDRREALYVRAVTDLALAQASLTTLAPASVVATRAFDENLLSWRSITSASGAGGARHRPLFGRSRRVRRPRGRLARSIAGWPRAFVHRDYQSRNLMVRPGEKLCWIDFQDALLGPRVYDLVALLNDSYQVFDRSFVEARLDDYAKARGLDAAERASLGREFDRVTVQRKLKDAGRFVFIDRVKGNPSFLEFVEPTIAKVRASLAVSPTTTTCGRSRRSSRASFPEPCRVAASTGSGLGARARGVERARHGASHGLDLGDGEVLPLWRARCTTGVTRAANGARASRRCARWASPPRHLRPWPCTRRARRVRLREGDRASMSRISSSSRTRWGSAA